MPIPPFSAPTHTYDLGHGYTLQRADKNLFAAYQTLYSNADVEQWYDWKMRLNDTLWSENGFFLVKDGKKLAGAILGQKEILYPFLILPFCDRAEFYRQIHTALFAWNEPGCTELSAHDVLDEDVEVLITMGYERTLRIRRVMIRPTDQYETVLPSGFYTLPAVVEKSAEIAEMLNKAYEGGIQFKVFGPLTAADVQADIERITSTNTSDVACLVYDAQTNLLVGACLAGVDPNVVNGFAGISEVAVLPQYQNRGLGSFLVKNALNKAYPYAPAMRLCVTVGNPAENLYRRLGFILGPRFTKMRYSDNRQDSK